MNKYNKYLAALLVVMSFNVLQTNFFQPKIAVINENYSLDDSLTAQNRPVLTLENQKVAKPKILKVWLTAYSSTPEQTDETPFITASGSYVRNGVVAANFLPMGAKIRIPEVFGSQIFVVEDRMHPRYQNYIDIWFPDAEQAKNFGKKISKIEIL